MKLGRNFVIVLMGLTLLIGACEKKHRQQETTHIDQGDIEIKKAFAAQKELQEKYALEISDDPAQESAEAQNNEPDDVTVATQNLEDAKKELSEKEKENVATEEHKKVLKDEVTKAEMALKEAQRLAKDGKAQKPTNKNSNAERAAQYDWNKLSKDERHAVKGKLAEMLAALNKIVEIDSMNKVTVTQKDRISTLHLGAEAFMDSLKKYEEANGEQFNPKDSLEKQAARAAGRRTLATIR